MKMTIKNAIKFLESKIVDAKVGLPEEIFLFASRLTPMVNVDLLINDERGRTLLSWRDDSFHKTGWHIPGGIIRFKETMVKRIEKVAKSEIGTMVKFDPIPLAVNEIFVKRKTRGHGISFLYQCYLPSSFVPNNNGLKETDRGYLKWHERCPENLLEVQNIYRKYIK